MREPWRRLSRLVLVSGLTLAGLPLPGLDGVAAAQAGGGQWVQTILQRPLFSPSRRPATTAAAPARLPRLAGIVIAPRGALAIFSLPGEARAVVAGSGGHVGPYLLRAVEPTGVTVDGPSGPQRLRPTYDPEAQQAQRDASGPSQAPPSILDLLRARTAGGLHRPPGVADRRPPP